jgi:hypothetical protein
VNINGGRRRSELKLHIAHSEKIAACRLRMDTGIAEDEHTGSDIVFSAGPADWMPWLQRSISNEEHRIRSRVETFCSTTPLSGGGRSAMMTRSMRGFTATAAECAVGYQPVVSASR